ncbi:DNA-3-methyladenine glycosylase I [Serratia fonticola]|uniref:DNA-3-methyladenine glycosylase I n=1 Tax=Serratia fonticola TaxID=47917 RepID=UPI000E0F421D|nr:DNA-3-methyladenine glycosylase I [Serratia fonticola]MBP0997113.1 DNA-3-methyladenine glycosylase I [Serratia fonticola]MBP1002781.1 DNA-3-methyladenine glycosylase I [Serratia fonticola]MBP1012572.1 DNA-3-methyladenine glycosylase I [Serratia fonticola]NYA44733.1 DNA-3-methyladenine glycosylase I [Serratia fonticola]RDL14553.1 DNA-3-methyladenine glycosylase I [Serratia fonticola]
MAIERCGWVTADPLYLEYHDQEWGVPTTDARELFEMLCLEGQQAGLSWITVLKKRENYRRAFHNFDPQRIAAMTEQDVATLMQDSGIIRHRGKIEAIINNAKAYLAMEAAGEDFVTFIWQFVTGKPMINHWQVLGEVPAKTEQSDALSKALKKRGFKFIGSTTCYAFMQASGLVNDHVTGCFCHPKQRQA